MQEENKKNGRRYGIIAACGALALAVVFGAYWMGRSAGAGKDVGEEAAKAAALGHAQVSEGDLTRFEIARDESDGAPVYEVKFTAGRVEYDYEVSAATGSIVKFSREEDEAVPPPAQDAPAPADPDIGEARAWEIAFDHAGVTEDPAAGEPAKLDYEDGVLVYELKFFSGGYEYDYEISAADGSVVKFKKEADGTRPVQSGGSADPVYIGEARAREIAYGHAGLAAADVARCDVELDHHDGHHGGHHGSGCCEYEIDFWCGGYEYEYKLDAVTGEILESGREFDD